MRVWSVVEMLCETCGNVVLLLNACIASSFQVFVVVGFGVGVGGVGVGNLIRLWRAGGSWRGRPGGEVIIRAAGLCLRGTKGLISTLLLRLAGYCYGITSKSRDLEV